MPWQRSADEADADATDTAVDDPQTTEPARKASYTEGKGRPTPKRRDAEKKRGPVAPPPMTRSEARARRKDMRQTMSKDERREERARQRDLRNEIRDRRMAGEEEYLLARDKGPVRRYARNLVDSRRNFAGLFTPIALVFIVLVYGLPRYSMLVTLALLVFVLMVVVDCIYVGRMVGKRVAERYPDSTDGGFKLWWYAASRALQMRRLRVPKPQVERGEAV
ncbi:membrane protein [Gordonia crocea]|uniref:Membrane protein n=2 Tax=Gordonia crocea TaxID=589162 RepID=A0A7I9UZP6_9ACTN|nr:membrane protein [Gordonia crocea]